MDVIDKMMLIVEGTEEVQGFFKTLDTYEDWVGLLDGLQYYARKLLVAYKLHQARIEQPPSLTDLFTLDFLESCVQSVCDLRSKTAEVEALRNIEKRTRFVTNDSEIQRLLDECAGYTYKMRTHLETNFSGAALNNSASSANLVNRIRVMCLTIEEGIQYTKAMMTASRPSAKSIAAFKVPFSRDAESFVVRESYHRRIAYELKRSNRAALFGPGGTGIARVAVEHCHRTKNANPSTSVCWFHVVGKASLCQSFWSILEDIPLSFKMRYEQAHNSRLKEQLRSEKSAMQLAIAWLASDESGSWLIVLDTVDDPSAILGRSKPAEWLMTHLPRKDGGKILITSSGKNTASQLIWNEAGLIHIPSLDVWDSLRLFRKLLPRDSAPDEKTKELAQALEYLPLAIMQAAAYISSLSLSVLVYLERFLQLEKKQRYLLKEKFSIGRQAKDAPNAIKLTLQLSLKQVSEQSPSISYMVVLVGLLCRSGIHPRILRQVSFDDISNDRDIGLLLSFSFISRDAEIGELFKVHRSIQLAIQGWLRSECRLVGAGLYACHCLRQAMREVLCKDKHLDLGQVVPVSHLDALQNVFTPPSASGKEDGIIVELTELRLRHLKDDISVLNKIRPPPALRSSAYDDDLISILTKAITIYLEDPVQPRESNKAPDDMASSDRRSSDADGPSLPHALLILLGFDKSQHASDAEYLRSQMRAERPLEDNANSELSKLLLQDFNNNSELLKLLLQNLNKSRPTGHMYSSWRLCLG